MAHVFNLHGVVLLLFLMAHSEAQSQTISYKDFEQQLLNQYEQLSSHKISALTKKRDVLEVESTKFQSSWSVASQTSQDFSGSRRAI